MLVLILTIFFAPFLLIIFTPILIRNVGERMLQKTSERPTIIRQNIFELVLATLPEEQKQLLKHSYYLHDGNYYLIMKKIVWSKCLKLSMFLGKRFNSSKVLRPEKIFLHSILYLLFNISAIVISKIRVQ